MISTTPKPGHSRAVNVANDEDIAEAWDEYDEDQEEEESAPDFDRKIEPLDDIYRDLLHDFPMVDTPLPPSGSDSFGDFVAKEEARAKAEATTPPKPEGPLPVSICDGLRGKSCAAFTPEKEAGPKKKPAPPNAAEASHSRALREDCPSFWINKSLANCREIRNDTELICVGLLNTLMQRHGYAFVSNEQLKVWLRMKNTESVRHLLARLKRRAIIQNTGRRHNQVRWVVRVDLRNPRRGGG